jgi:hypothetical protein
MSCSCGCIALVLITRFYKDCRSKFPPFCAIWSSSPLNRFFVLNWVRSTFRTRRAREITSSRTLTGTRWMSNIFRPVFSTSGLNPPKSAYLFYTLTRTGFRPGDYCISTGPVCSYSRNASINGLYSIPASVPPY